MSFHAKLYGTEKEPVRSQDVGALTGCTLAWWYNREEQNTNQESVLASSILEAAGREVEHIQVRPPPIEISNLVLFKLPAVDYPGPLGFRFLCFGVFVVIFVLVGVFVFLVLILCLFELFNGGIAKQ